MNNFNFYQYLEQNGYEKETIRERSGEIFATVYQKEVADNTWNAITVHKNKTITASSHTGKLEYQNIPQPSNEKEAADILKTIEEV